MEPAWKSERVPALYDSGATTAELELVCGERCYDGGWEDFSLPRLLEAFPRLQSLRLNQVRRRTDTVDRTARLAPGWSPAQLDALCQSGTGLVELGMNPVCGDGRQLQAAVARLQQLPHLRRLLMLVGFGRAPSRTTLQCLLSLTRLEELRCVVHNQGWPGQPVVAELPGVSRLASLHTLELACVQWLPASGHGQDTILPPGLTRLSVRAHSWEVLLPKLHRLKLQSLSVCFEWDGRHPDPGLFDLGSVSGLSQLTRLGMTVRDSWRGKPEDYGGGLVLPRVQGLTLSWGEGAFPPVVKWDSVRSLTYLCLHGYCASSMRIVKLDFRPYARLKTLVLSTRFPCCRAMRFPASLTGLQLDPVDDYLPQHLADVTGLRSLVLQHVPWLSHRHVSFRHTLSQLTSLSSFHCHLTYKEHSHMHLNDSLPLPLETCELWAVDVERRVCQFMPWLKLGACTVSFQSKWDRDGSARPATCLTRQGDVGDIQGLLRVPRPILD